MSIFVIVLKKYQVKNSPSTAVGLLPVDGNCNVYILLINLAGEGIDNSM